MLALTSRSNRGRAQLGAKGKGHGVVALCRRVSQSVREPTGASVSSSRSRKKKSAPAGPKHIDPVVHQYLASWRSTASLISPVTRHWARSDRSCDKRCCSFPVRQEAVRAVAVACGGDDRVHGLGSVLGDDGKVGEVLHLAVTPICPWRGRTGRSDRVPLVRQPRHRSRHSP